MIVATLATNNAFVDLEILLKTLELWYKDLAPTVYLYSDSETAERVKYRGSIIVRKVLDKYSGKTRREMETAPGSFAGKSLWFEFQMEKLSLLEWALLEGEAADGVYYLDSDICLFKTLPAIPSNYDVALSPHFIRERDEALYGKYNAGYVWVRTLEAVMAWRNACTKSRFFEQAALEVFDSEEWSSKTYTLPVQNNYGWWRMFQGRMIPSDLQTKWKIFRSADHSGILIEDLPLGSIHTHSVTSDYTTHSFNMFVLDLLKKLAQRHSPAKKLLNILRGTE